MLGLSRVNSRFRLSVDFAFKMTGKVEVPKHSSGFLLIFEFAVLVK